MTRELHPLDSAGRALAAGRRDLSHVIRDPACDDYLSYSRDRILSDAIDVFGAHGYQATDLEDLVAASGVSSIAFRSFFADKESCFLAALDRIAELASERVAHQIPAGGEWPDQLRAGLAATLRLAEEEPTWVKLFLREARVAGAAAFERREAMVESAAALLRHRRSLATDSKELPEDLELILLGGLAWLLGERTGAPLDPALTDELAAFLTWPQLGEERSHSTQRHPLL